ncbi:hypothetical protein HRbin02_00829 [Candidatus Calditenuaceae archaeon HR02]|nr:hypothetical protein HRbin02_00829 [Candidatus Calditenuaceae archaeon HR02]
MSYVDLAELIPETLDHTKVLKKTVEDDKVTLRFKYGNGRVGAMKIRRYVSAVLFGTFLVFMLVKALKDLKL